jgi:hypothetical protein
MPVIKKLKINEYEFGFEISDILNQIFETTGFTPVRAEKKGDCVKISFIEDLPQSAINQLEALVKTKVPHFKFKGKQQKEVDVGA